MTQWGLWARLVWLTTVPHVHITIFAVVLLTAEDVVKRALRVSCRSGRTPRSGIRTRFTQLWEEEYQHIMAGPHRIRQDAYPWNALSRASSA